MRIVSGIQPSGNLHLGNYLGAIRYWASLQNKAECIYCIADLHAITVTQEPQKLRLASYELTAGLLASKIDPKCSIIFRQSENADHTTLAWIFNCIARMGWMNRMTQFKDKTGKNCEISSVGLYTYPILMAADILVYLATHVPVGDDQRQHLELTRNIALQFNRNFKIDFFPIIQPMIQGEATRVMSLRDGNRKMSKSDPSDFSRLNLCDDLDMMSTKINRARTDSLTLPLDIEGFKDRAEAENLLRIYAALAEVSLEQTLLQVGGWTFANFKKELIDIVIAKLAPITEEMKRLQKAPDYLETILKNGAELARQRSTTVITNIKKIVGLP